MGFANRGEEIKERPASLQFAHAETRIARRWSDLGGDGVRRKGFEAGKSKFRKVIANPSGSADPRVGEGVNRQILRILCWKGG